MKKKLRIALIMGGGVSLGSFSGGAMAKLTRLLRDPNEKWKDPKIDVVSGASAGSMTLSLLLHHLFCGKTDDDIFASMKGAWVKDINIDLLMKGHEDPSLFPRSVVREIAARYAEIDDWTSEEAHDLFEEGTLASFALTNMNGIPVRAEGQLIRQGRAGSGSDNGRGSVFGDAVQTTFHDDVVRFALHREEPDPGDAWRADALGARLLRPWSNEKWKQEWNDFRNAAIASGAFPVAFPPEEFRRLRGEYPAALWPFKRLRDCFDFSYLDGGLLRNEPLREAIKLAAARDAGKNDVERVFILIDPHLSGTNEEYSLQYLRQTELAGDRVRQPDRTTRTLHAGGRLTSLVRSQAAYRDWLRAAKFNSRIEWYEDLVPMLDNLIAASSDVDREEIKKLLLKIYQDKDERRVGGKRNENLESARARMDGDLKKFAGTDDPPVAKLLDFTIRQIGGLQKKRKLNIVAITPHSHPGEKVLIKGAFMTNFGGFFEEEFRRHDFKVGEYMAHRVLIQEIGDASPLLNLDEVGPPEKVELADPAHRDYLSVSRETRKRFEAFIYRELMTVAKSVLPGTLFRSLQGINMFANLFKTGLQANIRKGLEGMRRGKRERIDVRIKNAPAGVRIGGTTEAKGDLTTIIILAGNGAIPEDFHFEGPGITAAGGEWKLEVCAKPKMIPHRLGRRLFRKKIVRTYLLKNPDAWFAKARERSLPCIRVNWEPGQGRGYSLDATMIADSEPEVATLPEPVLPAPIPVADL